MAQKRPTAVSVIGILNLIFGGLKLLGQGCVGIIGLIGILVIMNAPQPAAGQPDPVGDVKGLVKAIDQAMPAVKFIMGFELILGTILAVVLIFGGIGLLRMRRWGRTLSFVYAIVTLIVTNAGAIYSAVQVQPAMAKAVQKWQEQMVAKQKAQGKAVAAPPMANNPFAGGVGSLVGVVLGSAYAIVILIVLNLAHVRKAFARAGSRDQAEDMEEDQIDRRSRDQLEDFDDRRRDY